MTKIDRSKFDAARAGVQEALQAAQWRMDQPATANTGAGMTATHPKVKAVQDASTGDDEADKDRDVIGYFQAAQDIAADFIANPGPPAA